MANNFFTNTLLSSKSTSLSNPPRKLVILRLTIAWLLASSSCHAAGDYDAGKIRSFICAECHGERGNSFLDSYPNLCGEKYHYLVSSLMAYKTGRKTDEFMTEMVVNLSRQDIQNLAKYYSEQVCGR